MLPMYFFSLMSRSRASILDVRLGDADEDGGAACADTHHAGAGGRQDLLHGLLHPDAVEGVVDAGEGAAHEVEVGIAGGEGTDLLDGVAIGSVDADGGAELLRELELLVAQVDGDDGVRADDGGGNDGGEAHASHAEDGNALALLHAGGVIGGAGARHDRAADDGGNVGADVLGHGDDVLLVGDGVVGPGKDALGDSGGAVGEFEGDGVGGGGRGRGGGAPR